MSKLLAAAVVVVVLGCAHQQQAPRELSPRELYLETIQKDPWKLAREARIVACEDGEIESCVIATTTYNLHPPYRLRDRCIAEDAPSCAVFRYVDVDYYYYFHRRVLELSQHAKVDAEAKKREIEWYAADIQARDEDAQQDCDKGFAYGCRHLAKDRTLDHDYEGAQGYLAKACSLGDADSCLDLGDDTLLASKAEQTLWQEKGRLLLKNYCTQGIAPDCWHLGVISDDQVSKSRAHDLYQLLCRRGDSEACEKTQWIARRTGKTVALTRDDQ